MNNLIKEWKEVSGHTYKTMAHMAGLSVSHLQNCAAGRNGLGSDHFKKIIKIVDMERVIKGNPSDKVLLEYELKIFTGEIDGY